MLSSVGSTIQKVNLLRDKLEILTLESCCMKQMRFLIRLECGTSRNSQVPVQQQNWECTKKQVQDLVLKTLDELPTVVFTKKIPQALHEF